MQQRASYSMAKEENSARPYNAFTQLGMSEKKERTLDQLNQKAPERKCRNHQATF